MLGIIMQSHLSTQDWEMLTRAEWNLENFVREKEIEDRIGNLDPKVIFKG